MLEKVLAYAGAVLAGYGVAKATPKPTFDATGLLPEGLAFTNIVNDPSGPTQSLIDTLEEIQADNKILSFIPDDLELWRTDPVLNWDLGVGTEWIMQGMNTDIPDGSKTLAEVEAALAALADGTYSNEENLLYAILSNLGSTTHSIFWMENDPHPYKRAELFGAFILIMSVIVNLEDFNAFLLRRFEFARLLDAKMVPPIGNLVSMHRMTHQYGHYTQAL